MSTKNVAHKNEVHLAGTLAKDPDVRFTPTGKRVANLTLLTKYEQHAEYHKIVAWEALAERVAKLHKGDFLRVVGRLATRSWEDKATNQKKYMTEVVGYELVIPSDEPAPLTPDAVKGGTAAAHAILRPTNKSPSAPISDEDPF